MKAIDCRGLACPSPVLRAKETIESEDFEELNILVDNEAAKENVSRLLNSQRFEVSVTQEGEDFRITGKRMEKTSLCEVLTEEEPLTERKKIMVMLVSNRVGHGDDELGANLMVNFLNTLKEMGDELWRLVFLNNGVKLTIEGSEVLPVLKELEGEGIHILVCGTCLSHFDLLDKKQVGETTNMLDIVTAMQVADKVISI